jgi:hypothetical protein
MQNSVAKKIFAVGSAAAMTLAMFAPFAAHAAVHAAGTNVSDSSGTVWMVMPDGTRRAYTSAGAFLSYGFNSWSQVVTASAEDLALPQGSFIPPQDGSIICSDRNDSFAVKGTCYEISNGQKFGFTSAAVFTGLGFSFTNSSLADVSWMTAGSQLLNNTTAAHLPGTLVNNNGTVQLMGTTGLLGIPDVATFNSWGYSFGKVVPANAADKAMSQTGVMATRVAGQLSPTALSSNPGNPGPPVVNGTVNASLAYDTPAAQTVALQGTYNSVVTLATFAFSGNGTVTQLQVKRLGVSADTILPNVYLFNGNTRLTDAASVGGSSLVSFNNPNGLFTVNGSMEVSVVAEIYGNQGAGATVGVQLTSFAVANGAAMSTAISGNLFTTATASDLAYATFGTVTPASNGSTDPSKDVEVFRSNVTVNSRDMTMSRLIIRNIGSALATDINNFRLRIDGVQVAQTQTMDSSGYVTFSFNPVTLKAGTRVFSILADIIGGSSRNFGFQIRNKADVNFVDTQYNVTVAPSNSFPVGAAAVSSVSTISINSGTMTIVKATGSPSGNITDGSNNVDLADYTVTAYGEPMEIQTVQVGATSSNASVGSLRNGHILINGVQYGSTSTLKQTTNNAYTAGGTTYTLNYTVNPGTPVTLSVYADMYDNDGTNSLVNTNTVTAYIEADTTANVQRLVSLGYVAYPSTSVAGNAMTDVTGSISLSKNTTYANQVAPLPQLHYKLSSFNLVGSTSEDVTISSIDLALAASTTMSSISNVSVVVNGTQFGTIKSTVAMTAGAATVGATSTFSSNYLLKQNTTVPVEVWGDIQTPTSSYAAGTETITPRIAVSGTTVNSSAAVAISASGQKFTYGSSSLAAALDTGLTPVSALVAGNQTKNVAAFKFTATNDQYAISDLTVSIPTTTTVSNIVLRASDGSALTSGGATSVSLPGNASSTFSGLNIVIPSNSFKTLLVDVQFGGVDNSGNTGALVQVTLHSYKSAPSSSGTYGTTTSGVAANAFYVFKAIPTITNLALPTSVFNSGGTNTISKFTISSGGSGSLGWTHLVLTFASSSSITNITSPKLYQAPSTLVTASSSVNFGTKQIVFDTNSEQPAGDYLVKATVTGANTTADSLNTYIANPATTNSQPASAASATSTGAGLSESFVWTDQAGSGNAAHSWTTSDWNNDFLVLNLPTDSQQLKGQ